MGREGVGGERDWGSGGGGGVSNLSKQTDSMYSQQYGAEPKLKMLSSKK